MCTDMQECLFQKCMLQQKIGNMLVKETIHDINKKHQNVNQHIASFISIDFLRKKMPAELNSSLLSDIVDIFWCKLFIISMDKGFVDYGYTLNSTVLKDAYTNINKYFKGSTY